jgi:molybdenum cofactor cytidylyltransferase
MNAPMRLAAIILAAGKSGRLGTPKQLLKWRARTLVEHAVMGAGAVADAGVIVVTGANADEVSAAAGSAATVEFNPDWATGMASSLCAGLKKVPNKADGVLLMVCDQPLITAADLVRLVDVWHNHPSAPVAAAYNDIIGVPAVLPARLLAELAGLTGEQGAGLWLRQRDDVIPVPLENAATDVDTQKDYRFIRSLE